MILDAPMLDLALEGTVVAVAADRGHQFSKRQQGSIVLVEEHGVEGDAHAGAFVRHRYLARRRPRFPNLRQVHLIPRELGEPAFRCGVMGIVTVAGEVIPGAMVHAVLPPRPWFPPPAL